jgi:hypothetical protein
MTKILKFLELEWTDDVLHHEQLINKPHGISLSKVERSSDQVTHNTRRNGQPPRSQLASQPKLKLTIKLWLIFLAS